MKTCVECGCKVKDVPADISAEELSAMKTCIECGCVVDEAQTNNSVNASIKYCLVCGTKLKEVPTKTSWEEMGDCPKCNTRYNIVFGDYQGGGHDAIYRCPIPKELSLDGLVGIDRLAQAARKHT